MCKRFEIHCGDDLYHVHAFEWEASIGTRNSSLEGATKLKLVLFCSSWYALSDGIIFAKLFSDSQNQTMDYSPWFLA